MAYTTSDLVTELAGLEYPVYIGGPVEQNQLYYLHNHAEVEDALQIVPGILAGMPVNWIGSWMRIRGW